MVDVAVVGAGELGGSLASSVASLDIARSVHLIDEAGQVAAGKALDIAQSAPILGFGTRVSGGIDVNAAAGAAVIVIADRVGGAEWSADDGLAVLKRLSFSASHSVIICAGAGHRDLVDHGIRSAGLPRTRLIGSAPEALAAAVRAMVALEVNGSPQQVGLTLLGVPPSHVVVPWADATIGGVAATRVLDTPARRRLSALVPRLWPPGPLTLAAAAIAALQAILGSSRASISAFVGPDDSQGRRTRTAALPVRLGRDGIVGVEMPSLSGRDQVELETAMNL
jgi:malate dehydrogenase